MIAGSLEIQLRADIARLSRDMAQARSIVSDASASMARAANAAKAAIGGMAVGAAFGALAHQVLDAQREFDKLNASLVTATGSSANAAQAFKALQSFAITTPYSVQEATEAFIKMRNLGLDPSEKALRSYGNTSAAMGKGLNQMIEAVADAATSQFERLREFGITAQQNGDRVSLTFKGVTSTIGNNAKEIQAYLQKLGETDFAGGMERRAATLDGAISNLGDTWDSVMRSIASNGSGEVMQSGVLALGGALQDLGAIIDAVGGKATEEGQAVQEASGMHTVLTGAFKGLAIGGVYLVGAFKEVGQELGALAAVSVAVVNGDLKGVKTIMQARREDAESLSKWVSQKTEAILGSTEKLSAAQKQESEDLKNGSKDRLQQYAVQLSAEEKRTNALNALIDVRKKLLGIDPQDIADMKKIQTALDTGAISQAEYNRLKGQLEKQMQANSLAYKQEQKNLDAQVATIQRATAAQALLNQRQQEHIQFLKSGGKINDEAAINAGADAQIKNFNDQIEAQQKLLAIAKHRQDSQKEQKDIEGQIANLRTQIDNAQAKRDEDLLLLDQQQYRQAVNNYGDLLEAAQAQSKAQQDAVRDGQDEIDMLGMTSKQVAEVTASRLRDRAALLEQWATVQDIQDDTKRLGDESRRQAEALRALANQSLLKDELTRQKELWGQIESTAHDTFISIFDSGKSVFDRLRDTLKNGLLELLYQMTIKKWVFQMQADYVGSTLASAGASTASGLTSAASTAVNGASLLNGGSILGGAGSAIAGLGNAVGSSSLSAFGAGLAGNSAGMATTAAETFANAGMAAEASAAGLGASVAAALPYVGAAIAAFAILKKGFGHGPTEVSSQGLHGTLTADSVSGESYQNLHQDGGWFTSDRNWTDTKALSSELSKQLTEGLTSIEMATAGFAKALGVSADWISTYSKAFDIKLTGDQTKDAQATTDFFSGVSDEIATKLAPNLTEFQKSGETLSTTLQRLAGDFQGTDQVAQLLGKSAAQLFGSAGMASAQARESLISAAGGLSTLSQQAQTFNQNFLTDAERLAPVQKALADALTSIGYASLQTRDDFKSAVNGLIDSGAAATAEGAKKLSELLGLADAFAQVHPETATKALQERQNLQDQLDELTMTSTQLLTKQRDALDESNRALFDQVQAIKAVKDVATVLTGDVDSAYSVLQKVVEREKAVVQTSIDAHTAAVSKLQSLSQSLRSTLDSIKSPDQKLADRALGQAQIRAALAIAKAGGPLPDSDSLKEALSAVQQDAASQFGTYQDYLKDLYQTQNDIAALGNVTDDQLSVEQKALAAAQDQLKSLDAILTKYQDQIDVLKGQSTTLLSIDQATQGVLTAILAAKANPVIAAMSTINDTYQKSLGRAPDAAGLSYWQQQAAAGVSPTDIQNAIANSPEATIRGMYETMLGGRDPKADELNYWLTQMKNGVSPGDIGNAIANSAEAKTLHPFAVGTNFIPEDMPAMVHKGERIIPAADNRELMDRLSNPSSNNDALLAEIKALRVEVQAFRQANSAENQAIAKNTMSTSDTLERVTAGGGPMLVEIVS
ncbi:DUF4214 domain-containing protein [Massilia sp. Root335]|uniref:DUF4214 domain-containing protein n=1 Tax=Massilia sp. Root335 TaxID=1736517 RepID=UPI0006FEBF16|nr:DUF4214 domain-containing protein [Massilia sp. Root335]KQV50061.1 hypothetical protein ASC93_11105 [Massilia sp. Root335]